MFIPIFKHAIYFPFNTLHHTFPQIISFNYVINHKVNDSIFDLPVHRYSGSNYLIETFGNTKYKKYEFNKTIINA